MVGYMSITQKLNSVENIDNVLKLFWVIVSGKWMEICLSPKSSILLKILMRCSKFLNFMHVCINFSKNSMKGLGGRDGNREENGEEQCVGVESQGGRDFCREGRVKR